MARTKVDVLGVEAFLSIVEGGSFQEAAVRLSLSQTALSHRLRKLEAGLGIQLLVRTTRSVSLTRAGLDFLPKARRGLEEIAEALEELRTITRRGEGKLAFACLPTVAMHHIPHVLRDFSRRHPSVKLRIFDSSAREINDLIQSGTAEFGVTTVTSKLSEMDVRPLVRERFLLACRRDHPLARQKAVAWSEVGNLPLIRIGGEPVGQAVLDVAASNRATHFNWAYEVQRSATAMRLVQAGLGVAILADVALSDSAAGRVAMIPLRKPSLTRTLALVSKRGTSPSVLGEQLRDLIIRHFKKHVRP